jgi:hypothetical protein
MSNKDEFFNIIDDLASSSEYFKGIPNFNPPDEMLEVLDEVAAQLFNMVIQDKEKQ